MPHSYRPVDNMLFLLHGKQLTMAELLFFFYIPSPQKIIKTSKLSVPENGAI